MLSAKDKMELNARGRAAGLGLDLWPEAEEGRGSVPRVPWPRDPELRKILGRVRRSFNCPRPTTMDGRG